MTLFAWLAIAVGVAAMCSLLSVMYGFEGSLIQKVLKAYPHVIVKSKKGEGPIADHAAWTEKLRAVPGVTKLIPFVETEMIVQSDRRTLGGVVWGMPLQDFGSFQDGMLDGGPPSKESRLPQVVLGNELASRLGATKGSLVKVISPIARAGALGAAPRADTFEVSGVYSSGHYDFDQQYLLLMMEDAQDLMRKGDTITGWHVWAKDLHAADDLQQSIAKMIPAEWQAQSWTSFNSALFQSLKLEQFAMFLILSFAVMIAVMNIVITLMMHVSHKRRNIGVLRALGASKASIRRIFLWQGALMGGVGLALGAVLFGLFIVYVRYFSSYQLPEIYYDRTIPIEIRPWSIALIYLVATAMIFFATWYPSRRAAAVHPVEALRE